MQTKTYKPTRGYKKLLTEIGETPESMNAHWQDIKDAIAAGCIGQVKLYIITGREWNTLPLDMMKQLPTLADKLWKDKHERDMKLAAEEAEKQAQIEAYEYYLDHTEEVLVAKIDAGAELTEEEIYDFTYALERIEDEVGENRRWSRTHHTYLKASDGRYFCVEWEEGLTEMQEDSYYNQPYEVDLTVETKVITTTINHWSKK